MWGLVIAVAAVIGGCTARRAGTLEQAGRFAPASPASYSSDAAVPSAFGGAVARHAGGESAPAPAAVTLTALTESGPDRYLVRNATFTVEARDVRKATEALVAAVQAARGYVASVHEAVDELDRRSVTIEVRVPHARFDHSLGQIEALGKVLDRQVTAEDVTEEFVDSQAALRNLKRTESRLLEHLRRTGRLADTLLVEKELNRVRGEIERLEGRLRFLQHRVAFSTLTVTLKEAARAHTAMPAATYSSGQQASDAVRSLVAFGRVLWTGFIWIGVWAAVWAPIAVGGWLVLRRRRIATAGQG
jgi:hypothetical protein